ncbi:hypothetical protein ACJX0J_028576 [Zea mays]
MAWWMDEVVEIKKFQVFELLTDQHRIMGFGVIIYILFLHRNCIDVLGNLMKKRYVGNVKGHYKLKFNRISSLGAKKANEWYYLIIHWSSNYSIIFTIHIWQGKSH